MPTTINMTQMPSFQGRFGRLLTGAALLLALFLLAPFATVPAGSRGVMTTFGSPSPDVFSEGIHFRWPLAQKMNLVNVSIQRGDGEGEAASRDLQTVHTRVALNYHVKPEAAISVFRDLGNQPGERIIVPAVHEAVKAVTARFTAEELVAKRTEVRDAIVSNLREKLDRHGVAVDEFSIVNFEFSKTFNEAIEAKTTAEQLKLKADRDLERIKVEAEQKVARAEAEARSLSLQRLQVTPELIRLREMENQARAIEKWDGHLPNVSGGALPFIDVAQHARQQAKE
jgi:prohibitin 2